MVVDFPEMSKINFATPDICFLISNGDEREIANALTGADWYR
jgi:hypothetical protein